MAESLVEEAKRLSEYVMGPDVSGDDEFISRVRLLLPKLIRRVAQLGNALAQERAKPGGSYDLAAYHQLLERVERAERALEDQRCRWNRHSTRLTMAGVTASGRDMDDAVNAIDKALAAHQREGEA